MEGKLVGKKASGYKLTNADAHLVMGMVARGDRDHDIAAWFGVNQGRIAEVKDGSMFGAVAAAHEKDLPPKGPPGIKGRRLRSTLQNALEFYDNSAVKDPEKLISALKVATSKYDAYEA